MSITYIQIDDTKRNTAGAKAPADIAEICKVKGYEAFIIPPFPSAKSKIYQKLWLLVSCTSNWNRLLRQSKKDDIIIYQHPIYGNRVIKKMLPKFNKKGVKLIAVIHDLESLRGGIRGMIDTSSKTSELSDGFLVQFDKIICHNSSMKAYLESIGIPSEKLIELKLFDYLVQDGIGIRSTTEKSETPSIAIAGNLAYEKCRYIYRISESGRNSSLNINLYGNNYMPEKGTENMIWHGSFPPEKLPGSLTGDFGLVWDGEGVEACTGNTGEYLRYNNPHKTSLYLSAGMPVIVWKEAAVAAFVKENGCGLVVDSLLDLEDEIRKVTAEEYTDMCRKATEIAVRVREGYYFKLASDTAIASLEK